MRLFYHVYMSHIFSTSRFENRGHEVTCLLCVSLLGNVSLYFQFTVQTIGVYVITQLK